VKNTNSGGIQKCLFRPVNLSFPNPFHKKASANFIKIFSMGKIIAAINMSLDGFCDHTVGKVDEDIHNHYTALLNDADTILYGRITYQLMQYWQTILANPTGKQSMDDFAVAIDRIQKIVFSHTLSNLNWETATLATNNIEKEVAQLKQQEGKNILVGSPGLIATLTNLQLIDEYQLCILPVIAGKGLPLFKNMQEIIDLKLVNTKTFDIGAVIHYYQPEQTIKN
jgi:dihydrofolate reductase